MKLSRLCSALVVFCAAGSAAAHADTFNFSFGTPSTIDGSGTLTGSLIGTGEYRITGITGSNSIAGIGSSNIASLLPAGSATPANGTHPAGATDNDIFRLNNGTFAFDQGGLSYKLADGIQVNLFGSNGQLFYIQICNGSTLSYLQQSNLTITAANPVTASGSPAVAATPEPASLVLLGSGLLGMAGMARRRLRKQPA